MREDNFIITENKPVADGIYIMTLAGDTSSITAPGQFVNIALRGHYLRRPLSVCDWEDGKLTVIYKLVGSGTHDMSRLNAGESLSLLTGLGNGYDLSESVNARAESLRPVIIGGGVGVPPLYGLAKRLAEKGIKPRVILGFNKKSECFCAEEFRALGLNVCVTTLDGSAGIKGLVTGALNGEGYAYACGPVKMLRAVYDCVQDGQFSFEARMACGFGACMGCSVKTKNGFKRICHDGPVLKYSEIIWEE